MSSNTNHINKQIGIKNVANMEELYKKILKSFYDDFSNIDLLSLKDEELKRTIHTLKGLSGNIGAMRLNQLCIETYNKNNYNLLPNLIEELNCVIEEISNF